MAAARRGRPSVTSGMRGDGSAEALAKEIPKAVEALARGAGSRRGEVLLLKEAAIEAASLFSSCRVTRAYTTLMAIPSDEGTKPMILVKVELRAKRRRTILWKGGPLMEQLLRGFGWPLPWAETLATHLSPLTTARETEVWNQAAGLIKALKEDPEAAKAVREAAARMRSKERSRQEEELRQLSRFLVRSGWSESDLLKVIREEQCREVQES